MQCKCGNHARYINELGELCCGICPLKDGLDSVKISDVPALLKVARAILDDYAALMADKTSSMKVDPGVIEHIFIPKLKDIIGKAPAKKPVEIKVEPYKCKGCLSTEIEPWNYAVIGLRYPWHCIHCGAMFESPKIAPDKAQYWGNSMWPNMMRLQPKVGTCVICKSVAQENFNSYPTKYSCYNCQISW